MRTTIRSLNLLAGWLVIIFAVAYLLMLFIPSYRTLLLCIDAGCLLLLISTAIPYTFISNRSKNIRNSMTSEANLKRLELSYLDHRIEVHQNAENCKELKEMNVSRSMMTRKLKSDLKEEMILLSIWAKQNNATLVTLTHHRMAVFLQETCEKTFVLKPVDKAKPMLYIRWLILSHKTTGKVAWKRPKDWHLYELEPYRNPHTQVLNYRQAD